MTFIGLLREAGAPRWIVAISTVVVMTGGVTGMLVLRYSDISNNLTSVRAGLGRIEALVENQAKEIASVQASIVSVEYQLRTAGEADARMNARLDNAQSQVDKIQQDRSLARTEIVSRLSKLEGQILEIDRKLDETLDRHRAERMPTYAVPP